MSFWEFEQLRRAAGGQWLRAPEPRHHDPAWPRPLGVSIDTRTLERGQIFAAIPGERVDGHGFVRAAEAAGASMALVEREPEGFGKLSLPVLRVPGAVAALGRLARAWREQAPGVKVIAIAGSNGKTTTVRLTEAVLASTLRGAASKKSFNNALGVPLTMLSSRPGDQFLICEVGTNHPGELAELGAIVRPDIAAITSIGREHLEGFGDLDGVAREEASILEFVRPGGVGIVPHGCPELERAMTRTGSGPALLRVGPGEGADVRVTAARVGATGTRFELNGRWPLRVPMLGAHHAMNGAVAATIGRRLGLSEEAIAAALAAAPVAEMRSERRTVALRGGEAVVLLDAYNANPDSMAAALETLCALRPPAGGRRVAILGDMLELGGAEGVLHREAVEAALARRGIGLIVLFGPRMAVAAKGLHAPDRLVVEPEASDAAAARAAGLVRAGDLVLLKASRGTRLERVLAGMGPTARE
jgi:UDP-N-acetylmuramoyl-tripeptide--D-alanyl-D-alanine ligase